MAHFTIAESPILPHVQSTNSSPRCASTRDWEEFSCALLEDGFILTALELYTELLESGKEVPSLRDYFSNPGNFEHAIPQPPSAILHSSLGELVMMNLYIILRKLGKLTVSGSLSVWCGWSYGGTIGNL